VAILGPRLILLALDSAASARTAVRDRALVETLVHWAAPLRSATQSAKNSGGDAHAAPGIGRAALLGLIRVGAVCDFRR